MLGLCKNSSLAMTERLRIIIRRKHENTKVEGNYDAVSVKMR